MVEWGNRKMIADSIENIKKTRQTRVLYIISILAIGALFLVLFLLFGSQNKDTIYTNPPYDKVLDIGRVRVFVDLADTQEEQEKGLSGQAFLPSNYGKLFVFREPGSYGFWMKDMNFPIDIIWLDENMRVLGIEDSVSPSTYPNIFYPPQDVSFVLEVNAGFSTANDLSNNQLIRFSDNLSF